MAAEKYIDEHVKEYETTAQKKDKDRDMINNALEIVKEFIIRKKLILFGGLAIDYALRLKGDKIYPDEQRPDFDFFSPTSVDDAYELAQIFHDKGFEDVGAVRGIHIQTTKVRVDFCWVADIGYVPKQLYDKIPTIDYKGMRIVHPDYQRMDMHLAFCFPFSGAPREDVFHRWSKDIKRFNLLEKYYPIEDHSPGNFTKYTAVCPTPMTEKTFALHGFAAYAYYMNPTSGITAIDNRTIEFSTPTKGLLVASPWPEKLIHDNYRKFYPVMDVFPESYSYERTTIASTKYRLLSASLVKIGQFDCYVVSKQYLLLWLLYMSNIGCSSAVTSQMCTPAARSTYRSCYLNILKLCTADGSPAAPSADSPAVTAATTIQKKTNTSTTKGESAAPSAGPPSAVPHERSPMLTVIGDLNYDMSYLLRIASNSKMMSEPPPKSLGIDPEICEIVVGLPANFYPPGKFPEFDYDKPVLFRRAGQHADI